MLSAALCGKLVWTSNENIFHHPVTCWKKKNYKKKIQNNSCWMYVVRLDLCFLLCCPGWVFCMSHFAIVPLKLTRCAFFCNMFYLNLYSLQNLDLVYIRCDSVHDLVGNTSSNRAVNTTTQWAGWMLSRVHTSYHVYTKWVCHRQIIFI